MPRDEALQQVQNFVASLPESLQESSPLLPYQVEGITFGLHRGGRVLLGDEMGLGKTAQALLLAAQFESEWPLLVVAPSSLRFVWRDQVVQWLPHVGNHVHVVRNSKDVPPMGARIVISTYDLLRRAIGLRSRADGRGYLVVVVDESQNIKDPGSQRTKAVVGLCKAARRAILLSGTPALNRATELYTQLEAILPLAMPSFSTFAERYCVKETQRFGKRTVERWGGARRSAELNCLLSSSVMIRRLKKDVLDQLPAKRRSRVPLDPDKMDRALLTEVVRRVKQFGAQVQNAFADGGNGPMVEQLGLPELFRLTA